MSSDRNRVIAIFAGVAIVLGGGAFYYTKIFAPGEARDQAREEYKEWDARWLSLRSCLLGEERSAKVGESLAIHEMLDQGWTAKSCTSSIGKLARGPGESSGISKIEDAWVEVDRAGSKLAAAFGHHVATGSSWKEDALPGAIELMIAARANLRDALDLDDDRKTTLAALPQAELLALDPTLEKVRTDPYKTTAGGAIYFGKRAGKEVQVVLRAGQAPSITRVDGTQRSVPDPTWGAAIEDGKLLFGPVIESGTIATPSGTIALPPLLPGEQGYAVAGVSVAAQGGKALDPSALPSGSASRSAHGALVVVGNEARLLVAREDTAGAWALDPAIPVARAMAEVDLDGRVAAIWTDAKRVPHARIWQAGESDRELVIKQEPEGFSAICLTQTTVWLATPETVTGLSAGAPITAMTGGNELLGCSPDAAILAAGSGGYQICTAACRQAMVADTQHLMAVTDLDGKLVGVSSHGGVLGVWREGEKQPALYGLPEPVEIAMGRDHPPMALTNGKVLDVLATAAKGYVRIRVPISRPGPAR